MTSSRAGKRGRLFHDQHWIADSYSLAEQRKSNIARLRSAILPDVTDE